MRVLIAHSDRLLGESLAASIKALDHSIKYVHFVDTKDALRINLYQKFDVLILSPVSQDTSEIEEILRFDQIQKVNKRILLIETLTVKLLALAIKEGFSIFEQKNLSLSKLVQFVTSRDSNQVAPDSVLLKVLNHNERIVRIQKNIHKNYPNLTKNKRALIHYICEGLTTEKIAEKTFKAPRTIAGARYNLMKELGLKGTARLVVFAIENGLYEVNLKGTCD